MTSPKQKALMTAALLAIVLIVYILNWTSGPDIAYFRSLGASRWTAVILILSMAGVWAFAFPASIFFFIVPLLYNPLPSSLIMTAGSTLGALAGYIAARYIGGPWIETFREHRITKFLSRHSTFTTLFALRVVPSSPHGFINYGAGLVAVSLAKFLVATALGTAIKGFVYAAAVHSAVGATSLSDALTWKSVTLLFSIALLVVGGKLVSKRILGREEKTVRTEQ